MCALVGVGLGPPLALILAVAQLSVDPDLTGTASSLIIGIRSWGGATGASSEYITLRHCIFLTF